MSAKVCSHAEAIAELKALAQRAASLIHLLEAPTSQPQPQPVTREELDRVDSLAADRDAAIGARIAGLSNRIDGVVRRQSCAEQRVTDLLTMTEATRAVIDEDKGRFDQLAATVGDIANTLGRERVVERVSALEAMTLDKRIDALRARLDGQRIAGCDLASRVSAPPSKS